MTTLTEIVATVVVHSSAAAFSHFGLTLDPMMVDKPTPAAERVVAHSRPTPQPVSDCPDQRRGRARLDKA